MGGIPSAPWYTGAVVKISKYFHFQYVDKSTADDKKKSDDKKKDPKKKFRRPKQETTEPNLLLSCVYFDQNHTNYLVDRDTEEILHSIGLHLSRSQVRKIVQKVVSRDCMSREIFSYRKLTDKPKEETEGSKPEQLINGSMSDLQLAKGNYELLKANAKTSPVKSKQDEESTTGLITYQGSVVDIQNLLQKVEKSEQDRLVAVRKIEEMEFIVDSLRSNVSSSEANALGMVANLDDMRKRLYTTEKQLKSAEKQAQTYKDVIHSSKKSLGSVLGKLDEALADKKSDGDRESKEKLKTEIKKESESTKEKDSKSAKEDK